MRRIATIVEGHGEVEAVPVLLRRLAKRLSPDFVVDAPRPIRIGRQKILKPGELERAIGLAARLAGTDGCILILLDADDDCPAERGPELLRRARGERTDCDIRVVLAKAEYEAWFLAACDSIAGRRGIAESAVPPPEPESIRDAKGWLSTHMPGDQSYSPRLDQPALTAVFDLDSAQMAPSFDKLWRDVSSLLAGESAHDQGR